MTKHLALPAARAEISSARDRHLLLLAQVRTHSITNNAAKDGFLFLMAIPLIYAAWEGYFKVTCSICLKRMCVVGKKARRYPSRYGTLWLQREPFVLSYLQKLSNGMRPGRPIKKGAQFEALAELSNGLAGWLDGPVDDSVSFDDLVMTYSNVDRDVATLNGSVIGLDVGAVNFSRLGELVGRRNHVAHGGLLTFPSEAEVDGLVSYAEDLIRTFDDAVTNWLPSS